MPKLKIITIHLNNSIGFEKTFKSVYQIISNASAIHWLIKDGKSNPSEIEKIQFCLDKLPASNYQYIEKEDCGIYDAMNQALEFVDIDEMVLFLNSGDELSGEFIENFDKLNLRDTDLVYSDTLVGNTKIQAPKSIDFAYLLGKTINHQSLIINGGLIRKYKFNTEYKIVADWVQLFEILKNEHLKFKKIKFPICIYEGGGISEKHDDLRKFERSQYLYTKYSKWELESLELLRKLRQRSWYYFIVRSLDSPKRGKAIQLMAKWLS
jgi:hypothetical protein